MTPREEAQGLIHAELDRHRPLEVSRRTLELIAEMALRFPDREGEPRIQVVDEAGKPRLVERDGAQVPMDIPALVAEIRAKHPALFEAAPVPAPAAPVEAAPVPAATAAPEAQAPRRSHVVETPPAAPAPASRDWLVLRDGAAAPEMAETPARPKAGAALAGAVGRAGARLPGLAQDLRSRAREASAAVVDRVDAARDAVRERRARIVEARAVPAAPVPPPPTAAGPRPLAPATPTGPRITPYVYAAALLLAGLLLYGLWPDGSPAPEAGRTAAATSPARTASAGRPEPDATGAVPPAGDDRVLRGVPEVVDTVTLRMDGRIVRLFGVEWARGGQQDDLVSYLRDREIECRPVQGSSGHRCAVAGQDLSRVVLYNGGGRTNAEATPELLKAEDHARDQKLGVWKR